MRVAFFGRLRDSLGDGQELGAEEGESVAQLRLRLARLNPSAADDLLSPRVRACVRDEVVAEDFVLDGRECVEFLPPLSGG